MLEGIEDIIEVYIEKGIVTRNDIVSIDSRMYGRKLIKEIKGLGYEEACYIEVNNKKYSDYTGILFNSEQYNLEQARDYLFKYVLR